MSCDIVLKTPIGGFIASFCQSDLISLLANLKVNDVGRLTLEVPKRANFPVALITENTRIECWYKPKNGVNALLGETIFLVDKITSQSKTVILEAAAALDLLKRRIVAYQHTIQEAQAKKGSVAAPVAMDNLIKAAIRENTGITLANSYRLTPDPVRSMQGYLSVEADETAWHQSERRIGNATLFDVAEGSAHKAEDQNPPAPTAAIFDIVAIGDQIAPPILEFRTYTDVRGTDRRGFVVFEERDLIDPKLTSIFQDSVNRAYVGGSGGNTAARFYGYDTDPDLLTRITTTDPFALRERYWDSSQDDTQSEVDSRAQENRRANVPVQTFEATLSVAKCSEYGVNFFHGDLVQVFFDNQIIDVHLRETEYSISAGQERFNLILSSEINASPTSPLGLLARKLGRLGSAFADSIT